MVCSHRCSAEGTSASLLPETAEEVWNEPQNPQVLLHLHCGEHPPAVSPPGLETAPLATAGLCKGSCELPATLLEGSFPPSRISTPGGVQGKPGGLSKTPATRPTVCSLCCPQGDVSAASNPALTDSFFPQANKQSELIHPTSHSHFTVCHALHFNSSTRTHCTNTSAITGYHTMHIHNIAYA